MCQSRVKLKAVKIWKWVGLILYLRFVIEKRISVTR